MTYKKKKFSYVIFLGHVETMRESSMFKKLDATEELLLDYVMIGYSQNREIFAGELLSLKNIGSQACLQGRVKNLSKLGYVMLTMDASDNRRKKVMPTSLAIKRYETLSEFLEISASR